MCMTMSTGIIMSISAAGSRLPSPRALLRVAGRGRGWGALRERKKPPTPPHRFAGRG